MKKQTYDLEKRLLIKKPELLNDILQETEELIEIFVTSIKTAVRQAHGPERSRRAEKNHALAWLNVRYLVFVFIRRWTFDVRCSSLKTSPYGINATCEHLQNNLALMGGGLRP